MNHVCNAYLGPRPLTDRAPIGYRVLDAYRNEVASFTSADVVQTMPGWFASASPVTVPDTGGFIVWGTAAKPLAEEAVPAAVVLPTPPAPLPPTVALPVALTQKLDALLQAVERLISTMPSDRTPAVLSEIAKTREDMALVLKATIQGHGIVAEQALSEERKRVAGYLDKFLESVGANVN